MFITNKAFIYSLLGIMHSIYTSLWVICSNCTSLGATHSIYVFLRATRLIRASLGTIHSIYTPLWVICLIYALQGLFVEFVYLQGLYVSGVPLQGLFVQFIYVQGQLMPL